MKALVCLATFAAAAVGLSGQTAPVLLPTGPVEGGRALQAPVTSRRTTPATVTPGGASQRRGTGFSGTVTTVRSGGTPGRAFHDIHGTRQVIVIPQSGYGYDYGYSSGALRDLADAEWAKVRLMEEDLRQREEAARLDYDARMAELEAQKAEALLKNRQGSWDRATAMYPDLLDPKSKLRTWYEHLLQRAREMTDRWGRPVRAPELDEADYPEVFAHRAAKEIGVTPLPLPPPQPPAATPAESSATPNKTGDTLLPPPPRRDTPVGAALPD